MQRFQHFFLIFIIILSELISADELKMIKIFGKVVDFTLDSSTIKDVDCEGSCYQKVDCILAFFDTDGNCKLFDYNSTEELEVLETTKADGLYVVFKTTLPNTTCPDYDTITPVVHMGEDPIYWIKTNNKFTFQKCVGDWKMFQREDPNMTVCMQGIILPSGSTREGAMVYCKNYGERYTMTALDNRNESEWASEKLIALTGRGAYAYYGFWIDGVRNCTAPLPDDCDIFAWSDGYTVGNRLIDSGGAGLSYIQGTTLENCLQVLGEINEDAKINDLSCGLTNQVGVVCGYRLA